MSRPVPKKHPWRHYNPPVNSEEQRARKEQIIPSAANPFKRYYPR